MTGPEPIELAERALGFADGEAQATVVRERSLLSRFAVSRPTQATEVDDLTVSVLRVHDGHTGSADTNETTDDALRDVAVRAGAAARVASASGSSATIEVPVPAAQPDRPLSWRAMTFMKASVTLSSARTPVDEAMAVSTAPAVQIPKACSPAASQPSKAIRSAAPAAAGSSCAVSASRPSCGRAGAGAGSPG